jgi:hypothetical protein
MARLELSFLNVVIPQFMHGRNLGTKISASPQIKMHRDEVSGEVTICINGKVSGIGAANVACYDYKELSDELKALYSLEEGNLPLIARAALSAAPEPVYDPNDESPEAHRARVRAASALANKPTPVVNNDFLIQESRNAAMGLKPGRTAQVQTAQEVGNLAGVTGKRKPISHQELKAQVKAEEKTNL